jgi:hypothetical protein
MPFPQRQELADSLLCLLAEAQGEVDVRADRVFERLADEFGLTAEERDEVYKRTGNRTVLKWEQDLRMLRQKLKSDGLFADSAPGVWSLTAEGLEKANALLDARIDAGTHLAAAVGAGVSADVSSEVVKPVSVNLDVTRVEPFLAQSPAQPEVITRGAANPVPTDSMPANPEAAMPGEHAAAPGAAPSAPGAPSSASPKANDCSLDLQAIGFVVESGEGGRLRVRSPLAAVPFEADLLILAENSARVVYHAGDRPLLVVVGDGEADQTHAPAGAIVVEQGALAALRREHERMPLSLDTALLRMRGANAPVGCDPVELAAMLLEHGQIRAAHHEHGPIEAGDVYWYLFARPDLRGRVSREDVAGALELLASPAIGVLRRSGSGYVQVMSSAAGAERILRLGAQLATLVGAFRAA